MRLNGFDIMYRPMGFNDHFSRQARAYADYRPTYPKALAEYLAGVSPGRHLAWDCATGSGQAAALLTEQFERVVATDASAPQIANATTVDRVEFAVADASSSGLPDHSCDLVTVAQAVHWFDLPAFYAEARRVLRPRGVIALWCYVAPETDSPLVNDCVHEFQYGRVEPFWPPGRELVDTRYETLPFPFERLTAPRFQMTAEWTRDGFLGYVSSWSAVVRCREQEGADPLPELAAELARLWPDAAEVREVRWPLHLLVGRV
jgi:ubiquinone/menaquinone biosynthesis C-methylase UbiE